MTLLTIGVSLFVLSHLIPSVTPLRKALNNSMGEKAYKGVYSLIALTGFGLMIYGKAYAEFVPVWSPPSFSKHVAWLTMIPALILVVGANVPGNVKRFTAHPMMWGVLIWSLAHLFANGDEASIILFAPLGLLALVVIVGNVRGASRQTEVLPFSADVKVIVIGLVSYAIFAAAHPYLFKMPAF